MHHLFRTAVAMVCLVSFAKAHDAAARATYIGNEGVLVARGETKILFDAFYSESYGTYALVPDDISNRLMKNEAPYDGIDAIFVSHVHGDHFSAEPAIAYLRANPMVRFYGPQQALDAITNAGVTNNDPIMAKITSVDLAADSVPVSFTVGDLTIDVVSIPHAGGARMASIQNLAWRVTLNNETTVIHLGDAGPVVENFNRHADHFAKRKTNMAFPPYWFFGDDNGRTILRTVINADQTIGIHVPAEAAGSGDQWRARIGGDLFTDPGEARLIP